MQFLGKPQILQGVFQPQQGILQLTQETPHLPQGVSQELPQAKSGEYAAMTMEDGMSNIQLKKEVRITKSQWLASYVHSLEMASWGYPLYRQKMHYMVCILCRPK